MEPALRSEKWNDGLQIANSNNSETPSLLSAIWGHFLAITPAGLRTMF